MTTAPASRSRAVALVACAALGSLAHARPAASQRPVPRSEAAAVESADPSGPADGTDRPWRLGGDLPDWFRVGGEYQIRLQGLDGQFRADPTLDRSDAFVARRFSLLGEVDLERLDLLPGAVRLEVADSRQYGGGSGSELGTNIVDSFTVLQANADLRFGEWDGGTHRLRIGRQTIGLGSRRFVVRNLWRTAVDTYTGVDYAWQGTDPETDQFRAFWLLPVRRLPEDRPALVDNEYQLDQENLDRQFFGFFHSRPWAERWSAETYTYVLVEDDDQPGHRRIATPGLRLFAAPSVGAFDAELEAAGQFGASRLDPDDADLQHLAATVHAHLAYTMDVPWRPNIRLSYDYATGDRDPADDENNRFDTLFGAQRPDFGPTENYETLRRQNLESPELRIRVEPRDDVWAYLAYRPAWLASRTDLWSEARVRDPLGQSGSFLGNQIELRARWNWRPNQAYVEIGAAVFVAGEFPQNAPGGRDRDPAFGYVQTTFTF